MVGVKYIASVSFGKDSLAMLLKLMENGQKLDYVVFYDTGMEFRVIYRLRDRIRPLVQSYGAEFVELHPRNPFLWDMFERTVKEKTGGTHQGYGWCGGNCRWGTTEKLRAILEFKKSLGDQVTDYVGIAADESERFGKARSEGKQLPLVNWGMTEKDCLCYCRERGYSWVEAGEDLYDHLDRVSCWCCRNKNLRELKAIFFHFPDYWQRLRELQSKLKMPMKGNGKSVFELEERFKREGEQIKWEESK